MGSIHELIATFENEQKTAVFTALSDYLHLSHFTDVSLICQHQVAVRAHRVVLASSSKFFREFFLRNANAAAVDLDRELAPNGLSLTVDDVRLIIGILYCIGTVDISPERTDTLLVAAQVLGIPTLIAFLKKIRGAGCSFSSSSSSSASGSYLQQNALQHHPIQGTSALPIYVVQAPPPPAQSIHPMTTAGVFGAPAFVPGGRIGVCVRNEQQQQQQQQHQPPPPRTRMGKQEISQSGNGQQHNHNQLGVSADEAASSRDRCHLSPPSRSQSRATIASLGSFSLQPLPSPPPRNSAAAAAAAAGDSSLNTSDPQSSSSRNAVNSVLESFDPSFLNNLQVNQIDDLENALLPHLHDDGSNSNPGSRMSSGGGREEQRPQNPPPMIPPQPQSEEGRNEGAARVQGSRDALLSANVPPIPPPPPPTSIPSLILNSVSKPSSSSPSGGGAPFKAAEYQPLRPLPREPLNVTVPAPPPPPPISPAFGIRRATDADLRRGQSAAVPSTSTPSLPQFSQLRPEGNQDLSAIPVAIKPPPPAAKPPSAQEKPPPKSPEHILPSPPPPRPPSPASQSEDEAELSPGGGAQPSHAEEGARSGSDLSGSEVRQKDSGHHEDQESAERQPAIVAAAVPQDEITLDLENVKDGQTLKFAIPGSSTAISVNFSVDALKEMKDSVTAKCQDAETEVSSSTSEAGRATEESGARGESPKDRRRRRPAPRKQLKPSRLQCQYCNKGFSSQRLLDRHLPFHVETVNSTCSVCGKLFLKKWQLEEHVAVDHDPGERDPLACLDCGKKFRWERNLLAHMQIYHQEEKRRRCKYCPLTFLKKKNFIRHCRTKHAGKPETWCKVCVKLFDSVKDREDHHCTGIEDTGSEFICHLHDAPKTFKRFKEIDEHLKSHTTVEREAVTASSLKISCPVCYKKFLLRKNLNIHLRRYHDREGGNGKNVTSEADAKRQRSENYSCSFCQKVFLYAQDRDEHENTHRGVKGHKCHCGKEYSSKKALLCHQKFVHSGRAKDAFQCTICDKVLSNKYKLKYHMKVHTERRSLQCSICEIKFKARESLIKHVSEQHGIRKEDIIAKMSSAKDTADD